MKFETNTVILTIASLLAATGLSAETVDRTLPANADAEISVEEIIAGKVVVQAWNNNEVRIKAELGDDVEELKISGDADGYAIIVEIEDGHGWGKRNKDVDTDIEIWMPSTGSLFVESVSAPVDVEGVLGGVEVEAVSGGVELRGVGGGVEAESVSGSVLVEASDSPVAAESVSGTVRINGAVGEVYAASVSGSVKVAASDAFEVDLETVSGSITFEGSLAPQAEISAESVSGSVRLQLPSGLRGEFDIETFSGSIESDFGGNVERTSKYAPGKVLEYDNGDDVEINIETLSGSIVIQAR